MLHEVADFEEQAMAEQHTQYDVLVPLGLAQDSLPQASGLPSFSIIGKDYLSQNFGVHTEHSPHKPAVSEPPAEIGDGSWTV